MKPGDVVAIITGGASGLGLATAEKILEAGGRVALLDLDRSDGVAVAEGLGENAIFTPADVTNEEQVQAAVDELNKKFSNPEQLKKFAILPRDFTVDDGELTPTVKIRRKQINENWADVIEAMYADA